MFQDDRGTLHFMSNSIPFNIKQVMSSCSNKNVIRGLHCSPHDKYIYCNKGHIFDVIVSAEGEVKTFDIRMGDVLHIPKNYAHGFYCYEYSELTYFYSDYYDQSKEKNYHYLDPTLNIKWPSLENIIVSEKDKNNNLFKDVELLILGHTGYIGSWVKKAFNNYITTDIRLDKVGEFIRFAKPKYVICAAGISGRPTIDWCEQNKDETLYVNLTCQLNLIKVCKEVGSHLTIFGSGSIYKNKGIYSVEEKPDYFDLFYSYTRIMLEDIIKRVYPEDVLYLRVMYPISNDNNPKCFLSKLKNRLQSIHDIEICVTYLPFMILETLKELLKIKKTGIVNFVNEGKISIPNLLNELGIEHTITNFDNSRPLGLLQQNCDSKNINSVINDIKI